MNLTLEYTPEAVSHAFINALPVNGIFITTIIDIERGEEEGMIVGIGRFSDGNVFPFTLSSRLDPYSAAKDIMLSHTRHFSYKQLLRR